MPELNIDSTYGVMIIKDFMPVYADDNYARIFGYDSATELLEDIDSVLDLIDPKFHQLARDNYYLLTSGKMIPRGKTFTNIDRNGNKFSVFTVDHVIEWEGEPAVQVTVIDLSLVEEAHRKILENERKYKRLITKSGQGIIIHRDFKPLMVNQAWVDLMHAPSIDYVMKSLDLFQLIPENLRTLAKEKYQNIINGSIEGAHQIVENVCFDGETRFFNVYDNLIDWDGEPALQVVIEDVTEKVQMERELEYKASHDQLTGLLNREAIYRWLHETYNSNNALTCMLIDIDDFKSVNDNYGHFSGDIIIRQIAGVFKESIGSRGVVGRWGGEEFIIFCPDIDKEQSIELAETLRKRCEQLSCDIDTYEISRTISIGIAHRKERCEKVQKRLPDTDNKSTNKLIRIADQKLYKAKEKGKNRVKY